MNTYNEGLSLRENCIVLFIRVSIWSWIESVANISDDFIK